jgi:DNA-binding GntR family transcriptional regulator
MISRSRDIRSELSRETLVDRIVSLLEERILSGDLPPDTKLSEAWVAREFNVSRVPAREALQRLQERNLLRRTHLTREVSRFSREEFRELYELKNVVEAFGVMKGALRAGDEDLNRISAILEGMQSCIDTGEVKKLPALNLQFHDLLVHCSRDQKLIQTYESLAKQVRWVAPRTLLAQNRPELSLQEHRAIFEAFANKEAAKARLLMEKHTNESMERNLPKLEPPAGR